MPFVNASIFGVLWYQGENNMGGAKGNSLASVGYACRQKALVAGWRRVWSETPGTTDPMAPFGIVTLVIPPPTCRTTALSDAKALL